VIANQLGHLIRVGPLADAPVRGLGLRDSERLFDALARRLAEPISGRLGHSITHRIGDAFHVDVLPLTGGLELAPKYVRNAIANVGGDALPQPIAEILENRIREPVAVLPGAEAHGPCSETSLMLPQRPAHRVGNPLAHPLAQAIAEPIDHPLAHAIDQALESPAETVSAPSARVAVKLAASERTLLAAVAREAAVTSLLTERVELLGQPGAQRLADPIARRIRQPFPERIGDAVGYVIGNPAELLPAVPARALCEGAPERIAEPIARRFEDLLADVVGHALTDSIRNSIDVHHHSDVTHLPQGTSQFVTNLFVNRLSYAIPQRVGETITNCIGDLLELEIVPIGNSPAEGALGAHGTLEYFTESLTNRIPDSLTT
jgi:hypothetical protein